MTKQTAVRRATAATRRHLAAAVPVILLLIGATRRHLAAAVPVILLVIGAAVIVAGISMWTVPGATVLAGLFVIASGVLLLDVSAASLRRDRSRRP